MEDSKIATNKSYYKKFVKKKFIKNNIYRFRKFQNIFGIKNYFENGKGFLLILSNHV